MWSSFHYICDLLNSYISPRCSYIHKCFFLSSFGSHSLANVGLIENWWSCRRSKFSSSFCHSHDAFQKLMSQCSLVPFEKTFRYSESSGAWVLNHLVLEISPKSLCGQVLNFWTCSFLLGLQIFSKRPYLAQITFLIRKHQISDLSIQHWFYLPNYWLSHSC